MIDFYMKKVIQAENIAKLYRLGQVGTGSIFHDINRWWYTLRGKEDPYSRVGEVNDRTQKGNSEYVWALKDINFEVLQGEVLGIIGRNGAGKSTLLKILSRTTAPTSGTIKVKGRIASLLEVGTGFHPELSGRDNIFMNGTILGMTRNEIRSKFDEIVEFSGVERYLETPVKRYSSGMYVRLAFAVAAHLESEILIVDEVLAVGDQEFQKKCLGKMKDVSQQQGRTVLFVSHVMPSVANLSTRLLCMQQGTLKHFTNPVEGIEWYHESNSVFDKKLFASENFKQQRNPYIELHDFYLTDAEGSRKTAFTTDESIVVSLNCEIHQPDPLLTVGIGVYTVEGTQLFWSIHLEASNPLSLNKGRQFIQVSMPSFYFNQGKFRVELIAAIHNKEWIFRPVFNAPFLSFSIYNHPDINNIWMEKRPGLLLPTIQYSKK